MKILNKNKSVVFNTTFIVLSSIFFTSIVMIVLTLAFSITQEDLRQILETSRLVTAIWLSIKTSFIVMLITFVIGLPVAYVLARKTFPGRALCDALIELPIVMPPLITGLAILMMFGNDGMLSGLRIDIIFTQKGIVLAQLMVAAPFFIKTVRESISAIPENLFEAAASLRASRFFTLRAMIIPLSKNGIIAGLILTWARALGEFGATSMVAGCIPMKTETMTLAIYMSAMSGEQGHANAMALILTLFSLFFLILFKSTMSKTNVYQT
ncbi:molybdate ABC transporter permease subunit [candidate division KSB1 bacterium]|nr:molybdate ABC transporter permease subunit [candidate division KSB1 bacterium]